MLCPLQSISLGSVLFCYLLLLWTGDTSQNWLTLDTTQSRNQNKGLCTGNLFVIKSLRKKVGALKESNKKKGKPSLGYIILQITIMGKNNVQMVFTPTGDSARRIEKMSYKYSLRGGPILPGVCMHWLQSTMGQELPTRYKVSAFLALHCIRMRRFLQIFQMWSGDREAMGRKCKIHGGSEIWLSCFQALSVSNWLTQQLQSKGWPRGYKVGHRGVGNIS